MKMSTDSILIVEDEAAIALDIEMRLIRLGYIVCGVVQDPKLVVGAVEELHPGIVLMDINLKGKDEGIALAEEVINSYKIPVVFLTAFTDQKTFQKANDVRSYGFVTKPFKDHDLRNAIEQALRQHQDFETISHAFADLKRKLYQIEEKDEGPDSIFLKDGSGYVNIKLSEVLWIKAEDVYSRIVTANNELLVNVMLGDLLSRLPSAMFIRIHRSYIISMSHIQKVTSDDVIIDGKELPISKSYKKPLFDRIH